MIRFVLNGWKISRRNEPWEAYLVESPEGYAAHVSSVDTNPKSVLFKLAKTLYEAEQGSVEIAGGDAPAAVRQRWNFHASNNEILVYNNGYQTMPPRDVVRTLHDLLSYISRLKGRFNVFRELDHRIGILRQKYGADPNETLEEWIWRIITRLERLWYRSRSWRGRAAFHLPDRQDQGMVALCNHNVVLLDHSPYMADEIARKGGRFCKRCLRRAPAFGTRQE